MLSIRMQRTGRKGLAHYRMVVQDSRQTPTSGKVVASLGHYNPHTKEHGVDLDKAKFYLDHGAQPSSRVAIFLGSNGVELPSWVKVKTDKNSSIKNKDKLRRNQEPEPVEEPVAEATSDDTPADDAPAADEKAEDTKTEESPAEPEAPKEEAKAEEKPADEAPEEPKAEEAPAEKPAE